MPHEKFWMFDFPIRKKLQMTFRYTMRTSFQIWRPMEKLLHLPDTLALIDGDTLDEMPGAKENEQRNEKE